MALDKDAFLPAAFRKVQKIGKELKSNGTSNKIRIFDQEIDSITRLDCAWMSISLFTFCTRGRPLPVDFLSAKNIKLNSIFMHGLTVALFLGYSCGFGVFHHNIGQNSFYLPSAKNTSHFA